MTHSFIEQPHNLLRQFYRPPEVSWAAAKWLSEALGSAARRGKVRDRWDSCWPGSAVNPRRSCTDRGDGRAESTCRVCHTCRSHTPIHCLPCLRHCWPVEGTSSVNAQHYVLVNIGTYKNIHLCSKQER